MNLPQKLFALIMLTAVLLIAVAENNAQGKSSNQITVKTSIKGIWGGNHISVEINDSGAHLEFDCARAEIEKPFITEADGRFNLSGIFTEETGGPIRQDSAPPTYKVKISGQIHGKQMTLIIKRANSNKSLGIYKLTKNKEPNLVKCR